MPELVNGIDVSSHQPRELSGIIGVHQPTHVVVKLYLPEEAISQEHTRAQISSASASGCTIGGYVWCYSSLDPRRTVRDVVALARSCGVELPVLWLDCETYLEGGTVRDPGPGTGWLRAAVDECHTLGVKPGIYTGAWWWDQYMQGTREFGDLPLWAAQYSGGPDLASVAPFGGWTEASGKQWTSSPIDQDVFLSEVCATVRARTLAELRVENPHIDGQLADWQLARRANGRDPYDYLSFCRHLMAIHAPDPGQVEFEGFCPQDVLRVRAANPNIGAQLASWQWARRQNGEDPYDYEAFREHLHGIGGPDLGAGEFDGFCPPAIKPIRDGNPNIGAQLAVWQRARRENNEDPNDYAAFRQHLGAIGAPDPGQEEFAGFPAS